MVLDIRNARADALARELAELQGTTITEAVVSALDEAVRRKRRKSSSEIIDEILKEHGNTLTEQARRPIPREALWDILHDHESLDP